jgi:beta-glucosidase
MARTRHAIVNCNADLWHSIFLIDPTHKLFMKLKINLRTLLVMAVAVAATFSAQKALAQSAPQLNKNNIKQVIAAMTIEEKATVLVGMGIKMGDFNMISGPAEGQNMDKVVGAAGTTGAVDRLGIPNTVLSDGPAGLRINPTRKGETKTYYATAFPIGSQLACTWDVKLVEKVGMAMGNEAREYGVDVILGPGMNIHRNPLCGRNFEYYSEDPLLTGRLAAAMVKGIQGNGVGVSIKHFAGNEQETNRNSANSIMSERALREIYLRGFQIAVRESNPWTIMSSYNLINGVYTSQNPELLTTILRGEWGFKGIVMTDWFGGKDPVAQMKAGNDMIQPGTKQQKQAIVDAVNKGDLDVKAVDRNVERILNYVVGTHAFERYKYSNAPDLKAHAALVREAGADGQVLLKNNAALPFKARARVAAFGNISYKLISGGTGSGDVNEEYTVNLPEGLAKAGLVVDKDLSSLYGGYMADYDKAHPRGNLMQEFMKPTPPAAEMEVPAAVFATQAAKNDVAILTIGRQPGEGRDREANGDFTLTDKEKATLKGVYDAFHAKGKKVIVILNVGGIVETASWADQADGILLAWAGGEEAGNEIADVLVGKVNPSGKLASTIPVKYEDDPSAKNFPGKAYPERAEAGMMGMKTIPMDVTYAEGIYVGYRYYNTFGVKPAYPFGYGLSYTTFKYTDMKLSNATFNDHLSASVTVTNTGKVAGKESVQLYITAPKGSLDKPAIELKAFAKTRLLKPGESQTLEMVLSTNDLASFDTGSSSWVADAGTYTVSFGASSADIRGTAAFTLPAAVTTEKVNKVLVPKVAIGELRK